MNTSYKPSNIKNEIPSSINFRSPLRMRGGSSCYDEQ
jgi:hypothetical protein